MPSKTRSRFSKYAKTAKVAWSLAKVAAPYAKRALSRTLRTLRNRVSKFKTGRTASKASGMRPRLIDNFGGGRPTYSKFNHRYFSDKKGRATMRLAQPNFYETNRSGQVETFSGFQDAGFVTWGSMPDLRYMASKVPAPSVIGSNVPPLVYTVGNLFGEILLTNSSLSTAFVTLYDLIKKRDSRDYNGVTDNPISSWNQGEADTTLAGTANNLNMMKALPTDSKLFSDFYSIRKRTVVSLPQGGCHRHSVNVVWNKTLDNELLQLPTVYSGGNLKGYTSHTMIVVYGQPGSGASDNTVTTTAQIKLDYVQTLRYKYSWASDNARTIFQVDNLTTSIGTEVVNVGSGQIESNAVA